MEPDGDTCNHGLQHHIYPLFKVGYVGYGFLVLYAVGPSLIVHQVSARGTPSFAPTPQIAWQQISSSFLPGELKTARP